MFPASLKWILCFLRKGPNIHCLASLPAVPTSCGSVGQSQGIERGTEWQLALGLLFTWVWPETISCQAETGVRRVRKCPQCSQTSEREWENPLILANSPSGRPVCVVLRRCRQGQTARTGGDSVRWITWPLLSQSVLPEGLMEQLAKAKLRPYETERSWFRQVHC